MEDFIPFDCEISVIVARDRQGKTVFYGPMLNEHQNHILHKTVIPAGQPDSVNNTALGVAKTVAEAVDLTGILTVEFFVQKNGDVLVNEIAPRVHNSGHWTIDACAVSQFENHVRTVCGLPVGSSVRHSDATMINLIGDDIHEADAYNDAQTCLHLYGQKRNARGAQNGSCDHTQTKGAFIMSHNTRTGKRFTGTG